MGMAIFESSGTFNPVDHNLLVGDVLDIVCVSGGWSGQGAYYTSSTNKGYIPSVTGTASSFGSYLSVSSAVSMGSGGYGYSTSSYYQFPCGGGGAGGYLIGIPLYGGNGGDAQVVYYNSAPTTQIQISTTSPSGLGGKGSFVTNYPTYAYEFLVTDYGNRGQSKSGNKGAGAGEWGNSSDKPGSGGNGYGAGGGGAAYYRDSSCYMACAGGNSGGITFGSVKLQTLGPIAVTVGVGGNQTYTANPPIYGGKGADGVVVVTW